MTAQIHRIEAHLAARAGDLDTASEHWRSARQIMNDARAVFDGAVLALEFAEASPDDEHAPSACAEAVTTFERLRARPWLERARRRAARARP